MLKNAGVPFIPNTKRYYALRTVRALRATQWVELITEYKVMKWEPLPPNPLCHTDISTTLEFYAAKGCDNIYAA